MRTDLPQLSVNATHVKSGNPGSRLVHRLRSVYLVGGGWGDDLLAYYRCGGYTRRPGFLWKPASTQDVACRGCENPRRRRGR